MVHAEYSPFSLSNSASKSTNIDAAIPTWQIREIAQEVSYWGLMTGKQAELRLRQKGGNCYLIRHSEAKQHFVISVMGRTLQQGKQGRLAPYHFKLNITKENKQNTFEIEHTENKFNSMSTLLEFYQQNPVNLYVCSIGEPCIKK